MWSLFIWKVLKVYKMWNEIVIKKNFGEKPSKYFTFKNNIKIKTMCTYHWALLGPRPQSKGLWRICFIYPKTNLLDHLSPIWSQNKNLIYQFITLIPIVILLIFLTWGRLALRQDNQLLQSKLMHNLFIILSVDTRTPISWLEWRV